VTTECTKRHLDWHAAYTSELAALEASNGDSNANHNLAYDAANRRVGDLNEILLEYPEWPR